MSDKMSWIRKFFSQKGKNKIEEDEKREQLIQNKTQFQQQAEMKTRVTYEYPKRRFRFPVIEDNSESSPARRDERKKRAAAQETRRAAPRSITREPEKKQEETRSRKVVSKNKQPFVPTNIPSPIYGFKRPNDEEENTLEYELTNSFLKVSDDSSQHSYNEEHDNNVIEQKPPSLNQKTVQKKVNYLDDLLEELDDHQEDQKKSESVHKDIVDINGLETPQEILEDDNELETPQEILEDDNELETPQEILEDDNELETPQEILEDDNKLETPQEILEDDNELETPQEILEDDNELETPQVILENNNELETPQEILEDNNELETPQETFGRR